MHPINGTLLIFLQQMSADFSGQFSLEDQLHIDNLNRLWDRFQLAQQEKDMALQAEISRSVVVVFSKKGGA